MTLVSGQLDVPVVDTDGTSLRLILADTDHRAVASRTVEIGGWWNIHLDVLAASHRVVATFADRGILATETVACDPGSGVPVDAAHLPAAHRWVLPTGGHGLFRSAIGHGEESIVAARAEWSAIDHDRGLQACFPGHRDAVTALAVDDASPNSVSWRTWHCYPGSHPHVVRTTTRLEVEP